MTFWWAFTTLLRESRTIQRIDRTSARQVCTNNCIFASHHANEKSTMQLRALCPRHGILTCTFLSFADVNVLRPFAPRRRLREMRLSTRHWKRVKVPHTPFARVARALDQARGPRQAFTPSDGSNLCMGPAMLRHGRLFLLIIREVVGTSSNILLDQSGRQRSKSPSPSCPRIRKAFCEVPSSC